MIAGWRDDVFWLEHAVVGFGHKNGGMRAAKRTPRRHGCIIGRFPDEGRNVGRDYGIGVLVSRACPHGRHRQTEGPIVRLAAVGGRLAGAPLVPVPAALCNQHFHVLPVGKRTGFVVGIFRCPVILRIPVDMPDALVTHMVAPVHQIVDQEHLVSADRIVSLAEAGRPVRVGPVARHHRRTRRHAQRSGAIELVKHGGPSRQTVQVGGWDMTAIGAQHLPLKLVTDDHDRVSAVLCRHGSQACPSIRPTAVRRSRIRV